MELIIYVLMLFVTLNTVFKLSFWAWWQQLLFGVLVCAFTVWSLQFAVEQSKTQIADYLQNTAALQNMAILITIESVLCFGYCTTWLRGLYGKKTVWWARALRWYPGLLFFPVAFCLLTMSLFTWVGNDFGHTAWMVGGACAVALLLLAQAVRYLLPEPDARLEIHYLLSLFVCIIGLLTTVNGETVYAASNEAAFNWQAIGLSAALVVFLFVLGFVWSRLKWRFGRRR